MDHFERIYRHHAAEYHRMIAAEDVDGNLPALLARTAAWPGKRVLDLGTGTGRLPLLIGAQAAQVVGVDLHRAMLLQNRAQRRLVGGGWSLAQADARRLPFPSAWADVTCAGWALGHFVGWYGLTWQAQIARALDEMLRVTASGGLLILLETLGTGSLSPEPPTPELGAYYAWLERDWGFERTALPTDYRFDSVEQAVEYTRFFFGSELAGRIRSEGWSRLPEWTGMWVRRV